jgi:hypothetical protein
MFSANIKATIKQGIEKDFILIYGIILANAISIALHDDLFMPFFTDMLKDKSTNE